MPRLEKCWKEWERKAAVIFAERKIRFRLDVDLRTDLAQISAERWNWMEGKEKMIYEERKNYKAESRNI